MRVVIFGSTGMIGSGVVLECLDDPRVASVLLVGRKSAGVANPKVRELIHADFADFTALIPEFARIDGAFYCMGATSNGLTEAQYRHVTLDFTVAAVKALHAASPQLVFCFVSGAGSDSSEKGRVMWARVKGAAENVVLNAGFRGAYAFRPGVIEQRRGVHSRTPLYQRFYNVLGFIVPLLRKLFPNHVTSTEEIGRAMINVTENGYSKSILDPREINEAAGN